MNETGPISDLILSTFQNPAALDNILERIAMGSQLPHSVHVADDGSDETTKALLDDKANEFPVPLNHHWHENLGFRKCRILNKALSACEGNYVVFLDGDCLPHKHFMRDHSRLAAKGSFVQGRRCFVEEEAVVPLLEGKTSMRGLLLKGKLSGLFKGIRWPWPIIFENQDQRGLIGCNWAAWRKDLVAINGFDEEYEGWGIGEDSDAGTRLYNRGLSRRFVYGRALVFHLNHPQINKSHVEKSKGRLQETINESKTRCEKGLHLHT